MQGMSERCLPLLGATRCLSPRHACPLRPHAMPCHAAMPCLFFFFLLLPYMLLLLQSVPPVLVSVPVPVSQMRQCRLSAMPAQPPEQHPTEMMERMPLFASPKSAKGAKRKRDERRRSTDAAWAGGRREGSGKTRGKGAGGKAGRRGRWEAVVLEESEQRTCPCT